MHAKTALAVAGSVLAVPSVALAAADSNTPAQDALHPSGKLTHDGRLKHRLVRENLRLAHKLHRKPNVRRLRSQPVSVLRERNRRLRARVSRLAPDLRPAAGDRRLRVRRQPGHRHRQRLLRQVPVHAADVAERRRHRQPGRGPARPSRTAARRVLYAREGASPWPVCGRYAMLCGHAWPLPAHRVPRPRARRVPERRHRRADAARGRRARRARARRASSRTAASYAALRAPLRAAGPTLRAGYARRARLRRPTTSR